MPASLAAWVPVFIATPTSAWASAGGVVRPVAGHRDKVPGRLLLPDQGELVLGPRLGEEVVHPGLFRDRLRGETVVAGDHHRPDPHRPESRKAVFESPFNDVLEMDYSQDALLLRHDQRRPAGAGDLVNRFGDLRREFPADELPDGIGGALADSPRLEIDAAHAGVGRKGDEFCLGHLRNRAAPKAVLLGENDNASALRRLVGQG